MAEPTSAEQERLIRELGIPRELMEHSLDVDEVARMERSGENTLVVLRVPRRMPPGASLPTT